ncbi:MAG: hypothetical protein ABIK31_02720 [candidate division WOR-3 bacterium]
MTIIHKSKSDINILVELLNDQRERRNAFIELTKIASPKTIPILLQSLRKMTWGEALYVSEYLSRFGSKIIPDLIGLVNANEKPSVFTAAIKALGHTRQDQAFKFIFPLIFKEKRVTSNDITFSETIDAITKSGSGHLEKIMEMLDNSNWLIRIGGVYASARIAVESSHSKTLIKKLEKQLTELALKDRSKKVQIMAKIAIRWIHDEEEPSETFKEIYSSISVSEEPEEDLYPQYQNVIDQIFERLGYKETPQRDENGFWYIDSLSYPIRITLERNFQNNDVYLIILAMLCQLPSENIVPFYRELLELNSFSATGTAKFYISDKLVFLEDAKNIDKINIDDIVTAITSMAEMAGMHFYSLSKEFDVRIQIH